VSIARSFSTISKYNIILYSEPISDGIEHVKDTFTPRDVSDNSRNPITGTGLNGDGVGGLKPKIPKNRGLK